MKKDDDIKKWLERVRPSTQEQYLYRIAKFLTFAKMMPGELLDEFEGDRKNGRKDRGKPEQRVMKFYNFMLNEGYAKNFCVGHTLSIRSFYKSHGYVLTLKTPKATSRKENRKRELTPQDIKKLVEHAPTIRDRAVILMMFQGGFDVSTLCSLNYGDLNRELDEGRDPLKIAVVREKEDVEFFTFISTDAIDALNAYLNERRASGETLRLDSPLFVKEGYAKSTRERITTNLIQNMMKSLVVKAGVVTEAEMEQADMNPARPHALRSAFSTILRLNGFDPLIIDMMQGHTLPYGGAYLIGGAEKIRQNYAAVAPQLSINQSAKSTKELESKLMERMGRLETEKEALTAKIQRMEGDLNAAMPMLIELRRLLVSEEGRAGVKKLLEKVEKTGK